MSNLVTHAKRELERAGYFDKNSDYGGMLGDAVLELIEKFSEQGHSGYSAADTINLFNKLATYQALMPLTDDPEEWVEVGYDLWQNSRNSKAFSKDGGKTYTVLDDNGGPYTSEAKQ